MQKETLYSLVRAIRLGKEEQRAAIQRFKDRSLARMICHAAQKLPGCDDPQTLIHCSATLIIDRLRDALMRHAGESPRYNALEERMLLSSALSKGLESYRPELISILGASMRGQRIKLAPRPKISLASKQLRVKSVLEQSLLPPTVSRVDVERLH
jgi:hypothetical protein